MRTPSSVILVTLFLSALSFGQTPSPELVLQRGHSAGVLGLAFTPDARRLISAGEDKSVKVWEVSSGRILRTAPSRGCYQGQLGPNGHTLALLCDDASILLWDIATEEPAFVLKAPTNGEFLFSAIAWSPDGRTIVSVGRDAPGKIWDVATGSSRPAPNGPAASVAFSPDGKLLATMDWRPNTAENSNTVSLWDLSTGTLRKTLSNPSWGVTFAFSPDGHLLAVGNVKAVTVFDIATGTLLWTLDGHTELGAAWLAFSPDSRQLATGRSGDKSARLWDMNTGHETRSFEGHRDGIYAVAFSPDGHWLATGGNDRDIRLWEVDSGKSIRTFAGASAFGTVAFSLDARWLLAGKWGAAAGPTGNIWEIASGKLLDLREVLGKISSATPLSQAIPTIRYLKALGASFPGLAVGTVALSRGGDWIARRVDNEISLFEMATGLQTKLEGHTKWVNSIAFSADGRWLASGSEDQTIRLWEVSTHQEVRKFDAVTYGLAFSPDGRWLASSGPQDQNLRIWEVSTGKEARHWSHPNFCCSMVYSPDGRWLVTPYRVKVWEAATGKEVAAPSALAWTLAFSPNGRWLVTGNQDGSIGLWDTTSWSNALTLVGLPDSADWIAVTPEGLFDGTEDGMQKMVGWRVGNHLYAPDRFFADFYSPGLLTRVVAGERPKPRVNLASLKLPPDVRIVSPASGSPMKSASIVLKVQATDMGGGVSEVQLYHNGKRVATQEGQTGNPNYRFELDLVPGENLLKVSAFNTEQNVESNDDTIRLTLDAADIKPRLYLLAVGINRYEDPSFNLHFARQDGEALSTFFEKQGKQLFGSVETIKLFDKDATRANIRKALDDLQQRAQPKDVVIYYLAGHGAAVGQQFYFLTRDMRKEEDQPSAIRKYGISASGLGDAIRQVPALKQILVLDTCQSEAALPILAQAIGYRGMGTEEKAAKMLARSNGIYLIAASTKEQYALEVPELGHGVLTYALLTGLGEKGAPQATVSEGMVTIASLMLYIDQQVPELTEKYHEGNKQYPVVHGTGMNFPLVVK